MEESPHHLTSVNSTNLFSKKGENSKRPGGKEARGERSKFGAGDRSMGSNIGSNSKRGEASRKMSKLLGSHGKKMNFTVSPSPAESRM